MADELEELGCRVSAARTAAEARGETFYQGASRVHLAAFPPKERWDDWVELSSRAWPAREEKHYMLVPTTCFNCESACGLLGYVDRETARQRYCARRPARYRTGARPSCDTNNACHPIYSAHVPLSSRVPDLAALEVLLAVARGGSLTAASRELGLTQQAVSARVKSAEAQTGVALITRTPRGSALTPRAPSSRNGRPGCWRWPANSTAGWRHSGITTTPGCGSAPA